MVGLDDSVYISDCHAGAYSIWCTYMGVAAFDCPACRYIHSMCMGFCEDLQDRNSDVWQEDYIQGSLEVVENEVII